MATQRWKLNRKLVNKVKNDFHEWAKALGIKNADGSKPKIYGGYNRDRS